MKIIHCADLHLDSRLTSNLGTEKAALRKNELLESFRKMVNYAVNEEVNAIIIAGDLFDTKSISATACNVVKDAIVNNPQIEFYYLQGNHDANSFLSRLDVTPSNLKLFGSNWTHYNICGNSIINLWGIELDGNQSPDWFNTFVADADAVNIVVLHGQESAGTSSNKAEVIPFGHLKNKNINYLALGHIHSYKIEKLDNRGYYCYPGCLEPRGFDEPGEHGFVCMEFDDTTGRCLSHKFVKNALRTLNDLLVDITGCMTTTEISTRVEQELALNQYPSKDMLRIILKGEVDVTGEKDVKLLTSMFADRFFVVKVYDETRRSVKAEDYQYDESLKGEFVRTVLAADGISSDDKMEIISYGIRALAGEAME
ncbi:MAG: exonuclease SbcCD subunit D [Lachnospiraceae bacterium]